MTLSSCTPCMNGDMSEAEKASFCCLSSFRNRLFCSCTLPTHPAESQKQVNPVESDHPNNFGNKVKVPESPGIVARLMGLESMPEPNWVPKERNLDPVRRSRSANSIDYWSGFEPIQGYHRRIRTSWSFHDIPTFLQVNNNEFLLVRSEGRQSETRTREVKQKEVEKTKNKLSRREGVVQKKEKKVCSKMVHNENDYRGKSVTTARPARNAASSRKINHSCAVPSQRKNNSKRPVNTSGQKIPPEVEEQTRLHDREKPTRKVQDPHSLKKVESEYISEKLRIKPKPQLPVKEISLRRISNSRKKQQKDFLISDFSSTHSIPTVNIANQEQTKKACYFKLRRAGVCKLAEEDVANLNWNLKEMWKQVHIEEVGMEFGLRILDRLVHEVVAELSGFPMENLGLLLMEDSADCV